MTGDGPIRGAGFWRRAAAHLLVDVPLVTILMIPVLLMVLLRLYGWEAMLEPGGVVVLPWWMHVILNGVLLLALVALWKFTQATPGKKVLKLKVVDGRTGLPATTGRLWLRAIGYLVAGMPMVPVEMDLLGRPERVWVPLGFGFLWILIDRYRRGWHDLMSGTVTVEEDQDEKRQRKAEEREGN